MSDKWWIAADPGVTGGAAMLSSSGDLMFIKSEEPLSSFASKVSDKNIVASALEEVSGFPGDTPNTAFRLGASYGIWQAQLYLVTPEIKFVRPQKWQTRFARQFGERYCPKARKERKKWIQENVQRKLGERVTLALADAAALVWLLANDHLEDV